MSILDIFKRKKRLPRYSFDDEDRGLSLELRKQQAEIKKKEVEYEGELKRLSFEQKKLEMQDRIEELKSKLYDFDEEDMPQGNNTADSMLMLLLTQILNKNQNPNNAGTANSTPNAEETVPALHLTDEQLEEIIDKLPKQYLKMAEMMSNEQLIAIIKGQVPNIDGDSISRAIMLVRA